MDDVQPILSRVKGLETTEPRQQAIADTTGWQWHLLSPHVVLLHEQHHGHQIPVTNRKKGFDFFKMLKQDKYLEM